MYKLKATLGLINAIEERLVSYKCDIDSDNKKEIARCKTVIRDAISIHISTMCNRDKYLILTELLIKEWL